MQGMWCTELKPLSNLIIMAGGITARPRVGRAYPTTSERYSNPQLHILILLVSSPTAYVIFTLSLCFTLLSWYILMPHCQTVMWSVTEPSLVWVFFSEAEWLKHQVPGGKRLYCRLVLAFSIASLVGAVFITVSAVYFSEAQRIHDEKRMSLPLALCISGMGQ